MRWRWTEIYGLLSKADLLLMYLLLAYCFLLCLLSTANKLTPSVEPASPIEAAVGLRSGVLAVARSSAISNWLSEQLLRLPYRVRTCTYYVDMLQTIIR